MCYRHIFDNPLLNNFFMNLSKLIRLGRVATGSGKTNKNDKSQVKTGIFEKSQDKFFF